MSPEPNPFPALIAEGRRLLEMRPSCHKTLNDLTAAVLISQMHSEGGVESGVRLAEDCIARMRVAVETGIYPDEMLRKAGEALDGRAGGLS